MGEPVPPTIPSRRKPHPWNAIWGKPAARASVALLPGHRDYRTRRRWGEGRCSVTQRGGDPAGSPPPPQKLLLPLPSHCFRPFSLPPIVSSQLSVFLFLSTRTNGGERKPGERFGGAIPTGRRHAVTPPDDPDNLSLRGRGYPALHPSPRTSPPSPRWRASLPYRVFPWFFCSRATFSPPVVSF